MCIEFSAARQYWVDIPVQRKKNGKRPYTMRRRAALLAETRRRIVAAAVALHEIHGPARTTFSMVAARAGVQRHTLYAHFADERSLLGACSAHDLAADPPPDPAPWRAIADRRLRVAAALAEIYAWFERKEALLAAVLRDAAHHGPTREIVALRFAPVMAAYRAALGAGLARRPAALLELALGFATWRTLRREAGLSSRDAAALMAEAVLPPPPRRAT
jgi:AcrR family transcriptional regulator